MRSIDAERKSGGTPESVEDIDVDAQDDVGYVVCNTTDFITPPADVGASRGTKATLSIGGGQECTQNIVP